jgi:pyruvate-formate lyase-activating enzyme
MLCDGRIVCGCADPYGHRVLGDARAASVHDVWTGPTVSALRADLNAGGSTFCGDCPLKLPLKKDEAPPVRPLDAGALPSRLYIERTAACNISCKDACCAPETGITRTRQTGMLDFDLFHRIVDEVGASLVRIDFFSYGEAFLHKRAVEMCEYIKSAFPHIYLYTRTNGLALNEEQARRLARSGIDEVTFSIDGATPESYAKYRQRGTFDVAVQTLRAMADEKRRTGRDLPFLNWRYILFVWNDSDEEMHLARRLAADIGVDRLCWELTDHPEHAYSRRFVPGAPVLESIRHEIWNDNNLGNAIPGATPRARIEVRAPVPGFPALPPVCPVSIPPSGARGPAASAADARPQSLDAPLSRAGELRAAARPARRAALRRPRRADRSRLRSRVATAGRAAGQPGGRRHRNPVATAAGTLHAEVRSGE